MAKTVQVDLEAIFKIAERIVERFRPQRVILFGSQAKGQAHEGSDIDLCVVMETCGKPPHQIAQQIEREVENLAPKILWQGKALRVPVQVHVFSPEEFEGSLLRVGNFVTAIAREGIVLYEAEGIVSIDDLLARQKTLGGKDNEARNARIGAACRRRLGRCSSLAATTAPLQSRLLSCPTERGEVYEGVFGGAQHFVSTNSRFG